MPGVNDLPDDDADVRKVFKFSTCATCRRRGRRTDSSESGKKGRRAWKEANIDRVRELWRESRKRIQNQMGMEAYRERCNEKHKAWKEANPEWCERMVGPLPDFALRTTSTYLTTVSLERTS